MKDAFYFPHDSNATQDPKMIELLSGCGLAGIGFFWIIVEVLHQQSDGKITVEDFRRYLRFYGKADDLVEHDLNNIEQVLNTSGLLIFDGGAVTSPRVLRNKQIRAEISQKRSLAGRKSFESRTLSTSVQQVSTLAEQNPTKERKGKERKDTTSVSGKSRPESPEEVEAYAASINFPINGQQFIDYYEKSGWVYSKARLPVKDWKACVRTWKTYRQEKDDGQPDRKREVVI